MKRIVVYMIAISSYMFADFSAHEAAQLEVKAAKIREELGITTPTAKERKLDRIRKELKLDFDTSSKKALLGQKKVKSVGSVAGGGPKSSMTDEIADSISSLSSKIGLSDKKKSDSYSFSGALNDFYETIGLEEGESYGLPAFFGFNEKKKKSKFGLELLDDIEDTGKFIFKGMKYSGTSAEFSSGMMYRSSKMYNTMFGMFEDSPFNVFEEEEETSMFDVFEGGNKVLDMFD
jgi:hypothetical protein